MRKEETNILTRAVAQLDGLHDNFVDYCTRNDKSHDDMLIELRTYLKISVENSSSIFWLKWSIGGLGCLVLAIIGAVVLF